jgi:hypothetical protein
MVVSPQRLRPSENHRGALGVKRVCAPGPFAVAWEIREKASAPTPTLAVRMAE